MPATHLDHAIRLVRVTTDNALVDGPLHVSALTIHNDTTAQVISITDNADTPRTIMSVGLTGDTSEGDTYHIKFAKPWVAVSGLRIATNNVTMTIWVD